MLAKFGWRVFVEASTSSQSDTERLLSGVAFVACAVSYARCGHAITRIVVITNRWSCRLRCNLVRRDFVCCGSTGLMRRRSSTLCYDHNTSAGIVDIDLEYRYSTLKAGSLILMMACID